MKNKVVKTIFTLLLALTVMLAALCAGCFTSSKSWFDNTVKKYYLYPIDDEAYEETDFKQFAEKYLDRYSAYYTANEYQELIKSNSGSKSGIGISYSFVQDRGIYIASVIGNSPAYMCGLRAGEWLKSGNTEGGETVVFNSSSDFQNLINSAADGVKISVTSTEGNTYTTAKAQYTASYSYMSTNDSAWVFGDAATGGLALYEKPSEKISYLPEGAAYIRLDQFYGTAANEFDVLVEKFNALNCTSLILDLRSNGGGYVSVMQDIAYSFSGQNDTLAMLSKDKDGKEEKFAITKVKSSAHKIAEGTAVYVLANSGTASASEALIGAMHCYGALSYENIFVSDYSEEYINWLKESGQEVKTAQTYGKGIMQSTFVHNFSGEALKLTTAEIYWPDGTTCIHDVGLRASDGCTPVYAEWQHTKQDGELKTVVEIIKTR